ncbi:hypothetical protein PVK06_011233 [Gossypium arboreum]|uniref:Uncharacterized protein n=1 Tax=Gossypium arboreum TaxID=29729 RepID=A0ABR0Q8G5_GOSAR|nr:hypothetical protein PVK06_011233 [Gossypium arboreum]
MHRFIEGANNQRHTQIVSYEENEEFVENLVRCRGDRVVFEGGGMGGAGVEGVEKASQVLVQTSNKSNSSKRHPQHFFSTDYKHTNTTLPLDTRVPTLCCLSLFRWANSSGDTPNTMTGNLGNVPSNKEMDIDQALLNSLNITSH